MVREFVVCSRKFHFGHVAGYAVFPCHWAALRDRLDSCMLRRMAGQAFRIVEMNRKLPLPGARRGKLRS
jgi:hypothetical protein